jgi:hypothetical protein
MGGFYCEAQQNLPNDLFAYSMHPKRVTIRIIIERVKNIVGGE